MAQWGGKSRGGFRLVFERGGAPVELGDEPCVAGRLKTCALQLDEPKSSRQHFEVVRRGPRWAVRDLGSRNGTYLNGQRVAGEAPLAHGDRIAVGETVVRFESAAPPLAPGARVGPCEVVAPLGRGSAGALYLARQDGLEREVVLEVLDPDLAADARFCAEHEARAKRAGSLEHPGLQGVIDHGRAGRQRYTILERCAGARLEDRFEEGLERQPGLRALAAVARVLAFVHARGACHGALTAADVLVDDEGGVKLCGVGGPARLAPHRPDAELQAAYAAPEEARGEAAAAAADVYALGVLLFRHVAGRVPHEGPAKAALRAKASGEPVELPPGLPGALAGLVHDLLADSASERPAASEAAERIEALLREEGRRGRDARSSGRRRSPSAARPERAPSERRPQATSSGRLRRRESSESGRLSRRESSDSGRLSAYLAPPDTGPVIAARAALLVIGYVLIVCSASLGTQLALRHLAD